MTSNIEQVTTFYRQKICLLSAKSSRESSLRTSTTNLPSHLVAQHLLSTSHSGYIPVHMLGNPSWFEVEKKSSKGEPNVYLPCCRQCGAALQPGFEGTRVSVHSSEKLSRTRRRRIARKTMKKKLRKPNEKINSNLGKFLRGENSLHEGDRNYLLLECGSCQTNAKISTGLVRSRGVKPKGARKFSPAAQSAVSRPKGRDDFIPLDPLPQKRNSESIHRNIKKKKAKKDKLMNFLSSLNG